jgi:Leucine-rich repeat (LRR) protein
LDVSNCTVLEELNIGENPNLTEVCVWTTPFPPAGVNVTTDGSPNVYFTTECYSDSIVFIPDTAFLYALIDEGVDTNGDSLISYSEAEAITSLYVVNDNISDMSGIEAFINLDSLDCSLNKLTTLDVSNNTAFTALWCGANQLTSLDVSGCTKLEHLICYALFTGGNQLTSLDVSNNTALTELWCQDNQLTSLDVSNNKALNSLICDNNQFKSLDISNNTALEKLSLDYMPTLNQVCVWTTPFPPVGVSVYSAGSPNVYFTTECSITAVRDNQLSELSFYPNPTHNQINLNGLEYPADIIIYNISGQLMKSFQQINKTIDITELTTGVYILRLALKDKTVVQKVVKE